MAMKYANQVNKIDNTQKWFHLIYVVIFTLTLHKNHKIRENVDLSGRQKLQGIAQILPVCT